MSVKPKVNNYGNTEGSLLSIRNNRKKNFFRYGII